MASSQTAYQQTARLYRLLSGSNPMRIPLDKYVLSIMLEEILACANRYFARFSRERYALQRSRERASNNAYGGLDLEVLDGMTGHQRSVDTLSGGEQFLASLSLALGLSEWVQSQSGCVRLESLIIDEGFGSLDQETLDTAMKALSLLHQGGRNIGIISHVSELRNRIPARIEVSRLPDGTAKAIVNRRQVNERIKPRLFRYTPEGAGAAYMILFYFCSFKRKLLISKGFQLTSQLSGAQHSPVSSSNRLQALMDSNFKVAGRAYCHAATAALVQTDNEVVAVLGLLHKHPAPSGCQ